MQEHPCAGLYAITADMDFEAHYGKRAAKRRKMYNGMIPASCICITRHRVPSARQPMPQKGFDDAALPPAARKSADTDRRSPLKAAAVLLKLQR